MLTPTAGGLNHRRHFLENNSAAKSSRSFIIQTVFKNIIWYWKRLIRGLKISKVSGTYSGTAFIKKCNLLWALGVMTGELLRRI